MNNVSQQRALLTEQSALKHNLFFEIQTHLEIYISGTKGLVFYLFLLLSQPIPHRSYDLRHLPKCGVGVLAFNGSLGVPEEQGVRRHWLLGLIGILLLLLFGRLWLLTCVRGGTLFTNHLADRDLL